MGFSLSFRRPGLAGVILGSALLFTAAAVGIRIYGLQDTVPPGVTAGGLPLEGLKLSEAIQLMNERAAGFRARKLQITSSLPDAGTRTGTLGAAGLRWDVTAAEAALQQLQDGSPFRRAWLRLKLRGDALDPLLRVDDAAYRRFVAETWAELQSRQPTPARRVITEQDQVHIIPDVPAHRVDEQQLLERFSQYDWGREWREWSPALSAKDPAGGNVAFELPVQTVKAPVTSESLKEQGVSRKISEFTTTIAPGDPGRLHNITSAARTVHDRLLAPGEVFDYAPVIKDTEARYGFREAPVIYNGKLVPGIGGGICQVSSTLYNAVLRAGLEIVERRNHTLPVSYVPLGQDATFSDGYINFKFRNSSGSFLLVRTLIEKDRLTVKLFGNLPENVSYEIESITVQELDIPVKTVINPSLKEGRSEILQKGKPGFIVETYRTKKQNGTILAKELISKDRYAPQPKLVAIGGTSAQQQESMPEGKENVVEDGVSGPHFR